MRADARPPQWGGCWRRRRTALTRRLPPRTERVAAAAEGLASRVRDLLGSPVRSPEGDFLSLGSQAVAPGSGEPLRTDGPLIPLGRGFPALPRSPGWGPDQRLPQGQVSPEVRGGQREKSKRS